MAQGDYTAQAEALARSISSTQSVVNNISVITDRPVDTTLFEHVISIPENDLASSAEWKIHNRTQFLNLTPYDETVILDADMLFLTDVGHWWKYFDNYEMLLTSQVRTYRNEIVNNSPYRQVFKDNQLPDVYSGFVYFKKTKLTKEFFQLVTSIITNWGVWTKIHTPESRQEWPSIDVAMAMATKIMDIENDVTSNRTYPTFTHMKSGCQGWTNYSEDWSVHLAAHARDKTLKLGNYHQTGILHYVKKDFVTPAIMEIFK
jgi:hypothetical protein